MARARDYLDCRVKSKITPSKITPSKIVATNSDLAVSPVALTKPSAPIETLPVSDTPFWERALAELNQDEWEALCDGCGQCCLHKLEDIDNGDIYVTNVACHMLDEGTARCRDYHSRRRHVPDCVSLSLDSLAEAVWLPESCAYRLRAQELPLPDWHYLICGDRTAVHRTKASIIGRVISENEAKALENHIVGSIPHWHMDGLAKTKTQVASES